MFTVTSSLSLSLFIFAGQQWPGHRSCFDSFRMKCDTSILNTVRSKFGTSDPLHLAKWPGENSTTSMMIPHRRKCPLHVDLFPCGIISSRAQGGRRRWNVIKSICYFVTRRQMTNKNVVFFQLISHVLFCSDRTLFSVVVVDRPSLSLNGRYLSCASHRNRVQLRKPNYFFVFVLHFDAERFVRDVISCVCCIDAAAFQILPLPLGMTKGSPSFGGKILHFYCRQINYPVSLLSHSFYLLSATIRCECANMSLRHSVVV